MKKVLLTIALSSIISSSLLANDTNNNLQKSIDAVQTNCSGIKKDFDTIFGLGIATTVSSGIGTLASGGALAVGIAKVREYSFDENTIENNPEKFLSDFNNLVNDMKQSMDNSKTKTLGNIRTGLMAGATVTSAVSTGTSIGATVTADKLVEKIQNCNNSIQQLKIAKSIFDAEELPQNETSSKANEILEFCSGYSNENIKKLKNMMTASAITSGIGTGVAGVGTVTSIMANKEKDKTKAKKLDIASNIMAGVTTGTSGASTILSAQSISLAKKDSEMAQKCEEILQ
ncbi:MAG: hypothetical protein IKP65_02380 [Alphaproteobacteria bacterium]|nr:hypothetical protein [Alphaproteobacteria bacterium]